MFGDGQHAAQFHPADVLGLERGEHRNVVAAVAVEQRGMRPIFGHILAIREHHRHARAVFALVKHLLDHELVRIEFHFRLANQFDCAGQNIVAINAASAGCSW